MLGHWCAALVSVVRASADIVSEQDSVQKFTPSNKQQLATKVKVRHWSSHCIAILCWHALASTGTWLNPPKTLLRTKSKKPHNFSRVSRVHSIWFGAGEFVENPNILGSLPQSLGSSWAVFVMLEKLLFRWRGQCYQDMLQCCKVMDDGRCFHVNTDLRGLSEDEFGVFDQTLQRHSDIDDLCFLLFLAGFWDKLPIPGIQDDQSWRVIQATAVK